MTQVTIHRHGSAPVDVTGYVEGVTVRNAVRAPWGSISLDLTVPAESPEVGGITVGDWVVVKDGELVLGWGIVPFQSHRTIGGATLNVSGRQVQAMSWLDFLGQVEVIKAPGRLSASAGTMYAPGDWQRVVAAAFRQLSGDLGASVQAMLGVVGRVRLPSSLGGGYVGSNVRVVYDQETADAYARNVTVDPVFGRLTTGFQTTVAGKGRALAMLLAGVSGDTRVVEMFPAFGTGGSFQRRVRDEVVGSRLTDDQLDPFGSVRRQLLRDAGFAPPEGDAVARPQRTRVVSEDAPSTQGGLGATPVLVHRMVPWRTKPLADWIEEDARPLFARLAEKTSLAGPLGNATAKRFSAATWPTSGHADFSADDVFSVSRSQGLDEDFNAVTLAFPNAPDSNVKWSEAIGLPIHVASMIERYGLRVFDAEWPFINAVDGDTELSHLTGLAWQLAQWYLGAGRFLRGTASVRYSPWFQHGNSFSVGMPGGDGVDGYADAVEHSVSIEGDGVTRTTSIEYSRGLDTVDGGDDGGSRNQPFIVVRSA